MKKNTPQISKFSPQKLNQFLHIVVFFIFSSFLLFLPRISLAQSQEGDIFCIGYTQIPEKIEQSIIKCDDLRNTETLANIMQEEAQNFHENALTKLLQDNQSNPNYAAQKSIWELRKHATCLNQICQEVFHQCNAFNQTTRTGNTEAFDTNSWCQQKTDELLELGKTTTLTTFNENFARKERSLTQQKFNAIATRFTAYFQHWMPLDVNHLQSFANGVFAFIRYPY